MACPFCGSKELTVETPYVDRVTGKNKRVPCCPKSKRNTEYIKKRFDQSNTNNPDFEEVSKL